MTSTDIYKDFKPTYLYIKQHSITGKLYFGKTSRSHEFLIEEYDGSGDYWKDHIKIHGKEHIINLWYCLFIEKKELIEFAKSFCEINIIGYGNTEIWANLIPENGIDGGSSKGRKRIPNISEYGKTPWNKGIPMKQESKDKMSESKTGHISHNKGMKSSQETKDKISIAKLGTKASQETKNKMSIVRTGSHWSAIRRERFEEKRNASNNRNIT